MPFPSLIMGLIAKAKLKLLSGLTVVQRDYPISAHTVNRSIAHIKGSKIGVHMIPQDRVEDEGGDTEEEIKRFTSATKPSAQPSSSAPARGPDRLNRFLNRVEQMYTMLDSHMRHKRTSLLMFRVRSKTYHLRSMIYSLTRVQTSSSTSSSPLAISVKKGEKFLKGSLHSVRGSIDLGLETMVIGHQFTFAYF